MYLTFYLRVFEGEHFLGYLIDLSEEGIMIMSEHSLTEGAEYHLRMRLPSTLDWKGTDCTH
jgi:hypothetical protein